MEMKALPSVHLICPLRPDSSADSKSSIRPCLRRLVVEIFNDLIREKDQGKGDIFAQRIKTKKGKASLLSPSKKQLQRVSGDRSHYQFEERGKRLSLVGGLTEAVERD